MNLDLKEYTDPEEVIAHCDFLVRLWAFAKFQEDRDVGFDVEQSSNYHYSWLEDNAPWMIPHVDRQIIRVLRI